MNQHPIIRLFRKEDIEGVLGLINKALRVPASLQLWNWLFVDNPFKPPAECNLVLDKGNSVMGIAGNIFVRLKIKDKVVSSRWACFTVVEPACTQESIRFMQEYIELPYNPFLAFSEKKYLLAQERLGLKKIADVFSYIRILDMRGFVLGKIKNGFLAGLLGFVWNIFDRRYSKLFLKNDKSGLSPEEIGRFDSRFNALWNRVCADYPVITERCEQYLNWRFFSSPFNYKVIAAVKKGDILGYIVMRQSESDGIRRGLIVDLLAGANDSQAINFLLGLAADYFRSSGCHIIDFSILTSHHSYLKAVRRSLFLVKRFRNTFMLYHKNREDLLQLGCRQNWFITTSDPDLELGWR